jgi:TolB-like protein
MKNLKTNVVLIALTLMAFSAIAQQKLTVAVFNFSVPTNDKRERPFGPKITSLVTAELSADARFVLVERGDLGKALREQALGLSGTVDPAAAARVGQLTGAKVLIAGHVFKTSGQHLVVTANVIGTENGRLYVEKVEGAPGNLSLLCNELTRKIVTTIMVHSASLLAAPPTHDQRIADILKTVKGDKRPIVYIDIRHDDNRSWKNKPHTIAAETELSMIFQRAGFTVVDSTNKHADVEIIGNASWSQSAKAGDLLSVRALISIKVTDVASKNLLLVESQDAIGTDTERGAAAKVAVANIADLFAVKLLPLLSSDLSKNAK